MNILWIANVPLPDIAKKMGLVDQPLGGWLLGYIEHLKKKKDVFLTYSFPSNYQVNEVINDVRYASFESSKKKITKQLESIIKNYKPDIVHIFGTEFAHSYYAVQVCLELQIINRVLVSIQGLVSYYSKHYYAFLPLHTICRFTIRDFIKFDNLVLAKKKFIKRGIYEKNTLSIVSNVIGRTDWDNACATQINPNINYYHCNESLRNSFYDNQWSFEKCEKHSIFVSQASYPIKGFHLMLEAFAQIVKDFPDAKLYTTGELDLKSCFKSNIKESSYTKYLKKTIRTLGLSNSIVFLGKLNEQQMCEQYLKSNVFILCSSIENSPNSLGEAMILGVPSISADVGGVRNMFIDGVDGYIYPSDEPYMIAYYVKKMFSNESKMNEFSHNSQIHARKTHNRDENTNKLLEIYCDISSRNNI